MCAGNRSMSERKTDIMSKDVEKDPLFIKAICLYLEKEKILNQSQRDFFKKVWFFRDFQENHEKKKEPGEV